MAESKSNFFLSNKLFDRLKFIAQILLPALGTLCFTIGGIWNLEHTTEVVGTITAIDLFLGAILKISTTQYFKSGKNFDGDVNITPLEGGDDRVQFAFDQDPRDVIHDDPGKHSFEFRVNKHGQPPKI